MALSAFLKLDGISGESPDSHHAGELDVLGWTFGAANNATGHAGSGGGAGRVTFHDLAVTKRIDRASTALLKACATGQHIASGALTVRRQGAQAAEFFRVEFTDILVTSTSLAESADATQPIEAVSVAFGTVKVTYTQQSPSGGIGSASTFGWDVKANHTL